MIVCSFPFQSSGVVVVSSAYIEAFVLEVGGVVAISPFRSPAPVRGFVVVVVVVGLAASWSVCLDVCLFFLPLRSSPLLVTIIQVNAKSLQLDSFEISSFLNYLA